MSVSNSFAFGAYAKVNPVMFASAAAVAVEGVAGRDPEFCLIAKVKWKSSSSSRSNLGSNTRPVASGS